VNLANGIQLCHRNEWVKKDLGDQSRPGIRRASEASRLLPLRPWLAQDWDGWAAHDDTYVVDGENVVVLARYTATHRATAKELDVRVAHHFVVRGGLIVRFEQFVDSALVRDAATA
jgi:ketosteroid isomerase-like protein